MKLVVIIGPHAVGKMTVGKVLEKKTGLTLFHNHMSMELFKQLFPNDMESQWYLTNLMRQAVFERFSISDQKGMIFTFMPAFDRESNMQYLKNVEEIFLKADAEVYYVELYASQSIRLMRNRAPERLKEKPSKRNIKASEEEMIRLESERRFCSYPEEITWKNYVRIDNTDMTAEEAADKIISYFSL